MHRHALLAASAVALGFAFLGCADDACDGATADAVYATVVDATTRMPVDALLSVTREGARVGTECIERRSPSSPCERWSIGYMQSGTFDVVVASPGYVEARETITVAWGECGPETQTRTFALVMAP